MITKYKWYSDNAGKDLPVYISETHGYFYAYDFIGPSESITERRPVRVHASSLKTPEAAEGTQE